MPDDLEVMKAGIEAVASSALKPVNDLIVSIFGPAAKEAGLMLKDQVRVFRASRQLQLYKRAAEILKEANISPQQVPLKLLYPIIENASIEESDELQDRWANLLARAADPKDASNISVAFPEMLRELTPRYVKFLDALYDDAHEKVTRGYKTGMIQVSFGSVGLLYLFSDAGLARYPVHSPDVHL
jgi:Abortive infection alpha